MTSKGFGIFVYFVTIVHACLAFIEAPPGGLKESERDAAIFDAVLIVGGICNAIYVIDAALFVFAVGIRERRFGSTVFRKVEAVRLFVIVLQSIDWIAQAATRYTTGPDSRFTRQQEKFVLLLPFACSRV